MAIRLSGLTSGMDTDAIVQELVSAYSKKTEKYEKASTKLTWKQDSWKSLNTKIYDLYTKVSNMRYSSAYNLRKTTVSDASKATVTASSGAVTGTQKLEILSTAQSSYMTGAHLGEMVTEKTTLEDLGYKGGYTNIKYKSEDGEIKDIGVKKDTTINEVIAKLKEAGLNASFDENNGRIFVNAKTSGEKSNFSLYANSVDALDALDALGLNEALVKTNAEGNVTGFVDPEGPFAVYHDYYKNAFQTKLTLPTTEPDDPGTFNEKMPEKNDNMTAEEYNQKMEDYQKKLDKYQQDFAEWFSYKAMKDGYATYEKNWKFVQSTAGFATKVDYLNAYAAKKAEEDARVAAGDMQEADRLYTDEIRSMVESCKSDEEYDAKKAEAEDGVLNYYMCSVYGQYNAAVKGNIDLQISYKQLENNNNAWQMHFDLYESQEAARTSMDKIMEILDGTAYEEDDISKLIKDLQYVSMYKKDEEGKETNTFSDNALNAAKEVCGSVITRADGETDDEWEARVNAEAKRILQMFANNSDDVDNIENYVKSHDDISSLKLDDYQKTDEDGDPVFDENNNPVMIDGIKTKIKDIKAQMETNNTQLKEWEEQIKANQKIIDDNAEMKDIKLTDSEGNDNSEKFEADLKKLVEIAKKAEEIFVNKDNKYGPGKDKDGDEKAIKIDGSNTKIKLNGVEYTSETSTFSINGLTINALAETDGEISVTTTIDTQGIYDKVKEFLTEYNSVINEMTKLYNAESASDYEPLTDEEKEAMSEEQIEKWEKKIKDSLLRRDTTLNTILSTMVNAMAQTFEIGGQKLSLSTFGIHTLGFLNAPKNEHYAFHIDGDEDDENTSGKEDKLMEAIEANPDQVEEFMKKLCENLYSSIDNKMKSTELSSAYKVYNDKEMDKELTKYQQAISKWEEKVKDKEDYYYKQFSQMEVALSKLQSQTSSLSGLLGM